MNSGTKVSPTLDLSARTAGRVTIAELTGEVDIASVPALREQLLRLLRPGSSRLVIDLSEVSFCDASGLAVLVSTGRRARLLGGTILQSDETGLRVGKQNWWLWVFHHDDSALFVAAPSRAKNVLNTRHPPGARHSAASSNMPRSSRVVRKSGTNSEATMS